MAADITGGKGAEDGVAEGMGDHVGIGMAGKPQAVRDFYTGENELPTGDKAVGVIAVADTRGWGQGWLHHFFRQDQV